MFLQPQILRVNYVLLFLLLIEIHIFLDMERDYRFPVFSEGS